jgi:hypothetical protein
MKNFLNIYMSTCIIVIILNVIIFIYFFITNNTLKKSIDDKNNTLKKSIDDLSVKFLIPIGGSVNDYAIGPFGNAPPTLNDSTFLINVPIKGNYILNISASAITRKVQMLVLVVWINGVQTKYKLKKWGNETGDTDSNGNPGGSHHALIPISFKYTLVAGNNKIYLQHIKNVDLDILTYSDQNDIASINWIYSPL